MTEPLNRAALEAGTAAIIGHQKARKPWICGYEDMDEIGRAPLREQFEVGVRAYLAASEDGKQPERATAEAELDGLPMFAMVQGHDGFHHVKLRDGAWVLIVEGSTAQHGTREIALPATILHTPEGNK